MLKSPGADTDDNSRMIKCEKFVGSYANFVKVILFIVRDISFVTVVCNKKQSYSKKDTQEIQTFNTASQFNDLCKAEAKLQLG